MRRVLCLGQRHKPQLQDVPDAQLRDRDLIARRDLPDLRVLHRLAMGNGGIRLRQNSFALAKRDEFQRRVADVGKHLIYHRHGSARRQEVLQIFPQKI